MDRYGRDLEDMQAQSASAIQAAIGDALTDGDDAGMSGGRVTARRYRRTRVRGFADWNPALVLILGSPISTGIGDPE
jgi:hypothetical protein